MSEPNPYEPPRSELKRGGMAAVGWVIGWLVFSVIWGAIFVPGSDPPTVILLMAYGAASFGFGTAFARSRRGSGRADESA